MSIKKTNESELIRVAYAVFRKYGYHGTSMADISKSAGILKGSIYHYFASKEELLLAVLRSEMVYDGLGQMKVAYYERVEGAGKLKIMLDFIDDEDFISGGGCILGNLSLELSDSIPEATDVIGKTFSDWIEAVSHIYSGSCDQATAYDKAQAALQELQGAIMLSRVFGDSGYLTQFKEKLSHIE